MKLKLYSFLTFSIFSLSALGQVTLNKSNINPTTGDTVRMHAAAYMNPGSGGANPNWDFSSMSSTGSNLITFMNPANTMWKDSFATAPSFTSNAESLYFEYSGINDDSLFIMGAVSDYDTDTVVQVYQNPITQMVFPCTFNTGFTDDYFAHYDYLGIEVVTWGSVSGIVDGYGSLELPWGTVINTLRIKFTDDRIDSFDVGFGPEKTHVVTTRYTWYALGVSGTPVLNLVSISSSQGTQESAAYIDEHSYNVSVQKYLDANLNLNIYPNPINNTQQLSITFNSNLKFDIDEIIITDITGKTVLSTSVENNLNKMQMDISTLHSGMYFVTVKSGNAIVTKKLTVY